MTACARPGCPHTFTSANAAQRFCSARCRSLDNAAKRQQMPLALARALMLIDVRVTLPDAMWICYQVKMPWLTMWLERRGVRWDAGHWRMKVIERGRG